MKLDGKLALVTGAASGIGRETAKALARRGCRLVVVDLDEVGLASLAREVGEGVVVLSRRVDVGDRAAMEALAADVHALAPALDVLVNNAGVGLGGGMLDTPLSDWDWVLRVNLWGVVHGCHFFVPRMAERGAGHVVNVSSALGYFATGQTAGYATSKFAVFGLSESLRVELAPKGIGVSTICPGIIDTPIVRTGRYHGTDEERARDKLSRDYARRGYGPERVAKAIVSAIENDRGVVPVTPEAWGLWVLSRAAPGLAPHLARLLDRIIPK
jgi:NAD(P)-dependent dehydrogenase (short-subunit alcohol dehydrogenase family)